MKDMLKEENIQFIQSVKDWKEAIYVGVQPLVDQGYCEPRYADEIILNTNKYGPYYVLCENFALLHANADQGVIKKQLAITRLEEPIKFKEGGFDVRLLVTLAASDSKSHLEAMKSISIIFSDQSKIQTLLDATSPQEIYNQFMLASDEQI